MYSKITNISVRKYERGKMLAFVDISFDHCITIKNCILYKTEKDYFLAMPNFKDKNGKYKALVKLSDPLYANVIIQVLDVYNSVA